MSGPEDDPDEIRARVRDGWDRAAPGWAASNARFTTFTMPVSRWLLDAIRPQPGMRVLELAAGIGELGFLAAELVEPGGTVICTDGSEAMLERAEARAQELGIRNVEFKPVDLEWIDVATAEVDAVLCRWGYMFALDREAALRETRRVLRPGGRVALATWAPAERNPWATVARVALYDAGLIDTLEIPPPGPFELSDPDALRELLEDAGLADPEVEEVAIEHVYADVEDLWAVMAGCSESFASVTAGLDERQRADLRERLARAAAPYAAADGRLRLPGVALVAAADA